VDCLMTKTAMSAMPTAIPAAMNEYLIGLRAAEPIRQRLIPELCAPN
jgi:hypothetical protein